MEAQLTLKQSLLGLPSGNILQKRDLKIGKNNHFLRSVDCLGLLRTVVTSCNSFVNVVVVSILQKLAHDTHVPTLFTLLISGLQSSKPQTLR